MSLLSQAASTFKPFVDAGFRATSDPKHNSKRGKVVSRVNTQRSKQRRQQQQTPSGVLSAQDMLRLFQAMPVPNRGYKNPNADQTHKLGTGFDQFLAKNPHIKSGPERQAQVNQEHWQNRQNAEVAARSAVAEAKARQAMPKAPPSSAYGTGSITYHSPGEARPMATTTDPLTGQKVPLRSFLDDMAGVQATKYGPNAAQAGQDYFNPSAIKAALQSKISAPTAPSGSDQDFGSLFTGNSAAEPGNQVITDKMPEFFSAGMPLPSNPQASVALTDKVPQSMMPFFETGPRLPTPNYPAPGPTGSYNLFENLFQGAQNGIADLPSNVETLKQALGLAPKYQRVY